MSSHVMLMTSFWNVAGIGSNYLLILYGIILDLRLWEKLKKAIPYVDAKIEHLKKTKKSKK